jgi:hypothetical protein
MYIIRKSESMGARAILRVKDVRAQAIGAVEVSSLLSDYGLMTKLNIEAQRSAENAENAEKTS